MSAHEERHGHACATCADRADEATLVSLDGSDARVALADGTRLSAAVDLVPGVRVGDRVLVHQGVAIMMAGEGAPL